MLIQAVKKMNKLVSSSTSKQYTYSRMLRHSQIRQYHSSSVFPFQQTLARNEKLTKSSSLDETTSSARLRNRLRRAPFQKVVRGGGNVLFPWRSSVDPLDRLVPGTDESEEKGLLLGGNVQSSNPQFDGYATAYFFMNIPLYKLMFFQYWQADLAENMGWAFSQGVSGMLSNVYQIPFDTISKEGHFDFESVLNDSRNTDDEEEKTKASFLGMDQLDFMVESNLRSLFESAHQHGKEQIQVKLECKPTGGQIVNLFVFPFLSRNILERQPSIKEKYLEMLEFMVTSPKDALPVYHEFVQDFQTRGWSEHTVIAQLLVPCDEIFWVKDLATGTVIQGVEEATPRQVLHLVRLEMVVRTKPADGLIFPFRHSQGNWQITDVDDLLGGNLLL